MIALVFLGILTSAWGFRQNPMEDPNLFHGDLLGEDESERSAVVKDSKKWPNGVIPFAIDRELDFIRDRIFQAMKHISANTCIRFVPWDGEKEAYLRFVREKGCFSYKGHIGTMQPLSLGKGCESLGTIIHELMHAIGFDHEQNRPDRNIYVDILWQNIYPDSLRKFERDRYDENRLSTLFEYDSIMLYGEKAFSKDGSSKTMIAKKKGVKLLDVEQKTKLSPSDVYRVNKLYKCRRKVKS